jgi:nucleoside diphosphate kinase
MPDSPWVDAMFSVITPDSVRRHLVRPIVDRLRAEGLDVAAFRVTDITTLHLDGLYEERLVNTADAYRYRALDARMALGPAIALRLVPRHDGLSIDDWYPRLKAIKGASAPGQCEPGSIRHQLGAINSILSLLHCSDSPQFACREADLLLGGPVQALSWQDGRALDPLIDVFEAMSAKETRGFCEVVSQLRAGIALRLWDRFDDDGRELVVKLIDGAALCAHDAGARVRRHLTDDAAAGALARILASPFDPEGPPVDMVWVSRNLAAAGIAFDDWSNAVLCSSMYFAPRRNGWPR